MMEREECGIRKSYPIVQWTQSSSELQLRHRKRGREDGKSKGGQDGKESV
jgi:hypothetical protein